MSIADFEQFRDSARFSRSHGGPRFREELTESHSEIDLLDVTAGSTRDQRAGSGEVEQHVERSDLVPVLNFVLATAVQPNTSVPVSLTLGNTAGVILPGLEPDICTRNGFNGFVLDVSLFVDGAFVSSEQKCLNAVENRTWDFSYISGRGGTTHDVVLEVRGAVTGNLLHTIERTVDVRSTAPPPVECETDADCPNDLVCRDGQCVEPEGSNNILLGAIGLSLAILVILIGLTTIS